MSLVIDILIGLVWGLVATFFVATAIQSVNTDGEFRYEGEDGGFHFAGLNTLGVPEWLAAAGVGVIFWMSWFVPPLAAPTWAAWVCLALYILMAVAFICLMIYGGLEINRVLVTLPFLALSGLFWGHLYHAGLYAVVVCDAFWTSVVTTLPPILFVVSVALWITTWLFYRVHDIDEPKSGALYRDRIFAWVTIVIKLVVAIALAVTGVFGIAIGAPSGTVGNPENAYADEVADTLTFAEYYDQLLVEQYNDISWIFDDRSLVPWDKERVAAAGFSDPLAFPQPDLASIRDANLRNVTLFVTKCFFWKDKTIAGHRIGDLNPWMDEVCKQVSTRDEGIFYLVEWADESQRIIVVSDKCRLMMAKMDSFEGCFVYQGVQHRTTIENWCLDTFNKENPKRWGTPASYQYDGDFHVFAYVPKSERGKESAIGLFVFGINVHDGRPAIFGTEPEVVYETGTPVSTTPGGNPGGGNPGGNPGGDNPGGNPPGDDKPDGGDPGDDEITYDKDKSKGIETAPGEKDENTNNESDANHSTKDTTDGSTSMNHDQYRDDMDQKDEANNGSQREAGESNEPTTPAKPGADVDNAGGEAANSGTEKTNVATGNEGAATKNPDGDGKWGPDGQLE